MRKVPAFVLCTLMFATGCSDGGPDDLTRELAAARSQIAEAREDARESDRAFVRTADQLQQVRKQLMRLQNPDRPGQGLVVSIPLVGSLTWRCNDARRFSFTFVPEGATVTVQHSIDGQVTKKVLHSGGELRGPFLKPTVHQEWTVTYRHKPGTISAGMSVLPAVSRGACYIRNFTLEENRRP